MSMISFLLFKDVDLRADFPHPLPLVLLDLHQVLHLCLLVEESTPTTDNG